MQRLSVVCTFLCLFFVANVSAQEAANLRNDTLEKSVLQKTFSRLTVGGYGEAVYNYNFFSDNMFRYSHAKDYTDSKGHGRVDLPHAVIMLGYDFGRGWSVGMEVEFEHGGTESAVEIEPEETGEFEKEIERGGEVALEQFWVEKSFRPWLKLRMGHMVVPVGMTNNNHTPNMFFNIYRPEGENTIMPCTWHETGISLWGHFGKNQSWRYEVMALPALNSNMFTESGWVHNGSASAYEFKVANNLAAAARIDNTSIPGLRLSLSGYVGNSFNNDIVTNQSKKYENVKGTVFIGAFDFAYRHKWFVVRGNADYGHLSDAAAISAHNKSQNHSSTSPYPHTMVGEAAYAMGLEAGVNVLANSQRNRKLFVFGRFDWYDSYKPAVDLVDIDWCERKVLSGGINYYPLPEIAIKAEGGVRLLADQYNNEPWVAVGITWCGFFK
ncbi:MAG: hypothetical protein IJP95_06165 [Bacteroidales bacterium]|nr:hypothetical protein [Bacteroidales bacterium]